MNEPLPEAPQPDGAAPAADASPAPIPPIIYIQVAAGPVLQERLARLSRASGMRPAEVAAAILESTQQAATGRCSRFPEAPAHPAPPAAGELQNLQVPISSKLGSHLTRLSLASGLTREEVALIILETVPPKAVVPAVRALRELAAARLQDLNLPLAHQEASHADSL